MAQWVTVFTLFTTVSCTEVTAQSLSANTAYIYTQKLTAEDGLSESIINAITKDCDGFIWVGTDRGLNRFDGYRFKIFNHATDDSTSLGNDKVNVLFTDSRKRLWVGTSNGGLNLFQQNSQNFIRFVNNPGDSNSLSQNTILSVTEDRDGNIWVGTYAGLNRFNTASGTFQRMHAHTGKKSIAGDIIYSLMTDHAGRIWAGTENGISIINPHGEIINYYADQSGVRLNKVLTMCQTNDYDVWIGTEGNGVVRYNERKNRFQRYELNFTNSSDNGSNVIRKIIEDQEGNLLLGTDGAGVIILNPATGKFNRVSSRNDPSLFNAGVYDLYLDNENILWIGTYGGGLKIRNNQKYFMQHDIFDSAAQKFGKSSVLAIAEDKNHHIWIGTDGAGLHRFDPVTKTIITYAHIPGEKNTISGNVIKSLLVDRRGNIYAGTYNAGLNYIDLKKNTITTYRHDAADLNSLSSDNVWCLFEDSDGRIWVGSNSSGVDEFLPDKKIFVHYGHNNMSPSSLSSNVIFTIFEDRHKNLWFGTRDDGLNKMNKADRTFVRYNITNGLSSNEIREIMEDQRGKLWVGTNNGGLNYYDSAVSGFRAFRKERFHEEDILSILEDRNGNLWLGTFNGLVRLDPTTGKIRYYDAGDGLRGNEFNYGARLKSSTHEFYFGGLNGLNSFRPEDIEESTSVPPVVLTGLKLFHKEVAINDETSILQMPVTYQSEITLAPGQDVITIEYAALSFQLPRKGAYQYILEGFDTSWNYAGAEHSATYTNLPHGKYIFRVIGANNDGLWNEHGATLHINVLPPWYQIRWVQLLLILGFAGVITGIIHVRTRLLLRQKHRLETLVNERTTQIKRQNAEIESKNTELEKQNEELIARNEEIMAQREEIEEKSQMLQRAHEEIQTVNDQLVRVNGNLEKLVEVRTAELKEALQKLIETDEGLNLFLYRSSHDLRGPITTLQGLAGLARKENNQNEIAHYFDKILISCEHMLRVLKKLNDTNEIFRATITSVNVQWDNLIDEALREIVKLDPCGNVNVIVDNRADNKVQSTPFLIRNVIHNLMENAITFRSKTSPFVKLLIENCNNQVVIVVHDNGIGISDEIKGRIFEMFYRGSERSVGNGLGLYLVKKSVELLNGKIEIKSEVGRFTEVTVTLPVTVKENGDSPVHG